MRIPYVTRLLAALLLAALPACASLPRGARPIDLSGPWVFDMDVGQATMTRGAFTLARAGDGYTGELTTNRGNQRLPVRSVQVVRDSVTMRVESPQGEVVFRGLLDAPTGTMEGMVTYHTGALFPMRVRRGP